MSFVSGDPVVLIRERVSVAGGQERVFAEDSKGRVCKVHASGFCCVMFANRCLRVREDSLQAAAEPAPNCSPACRAGC